MQPGAAARALRNSASWPLWKVWNRPTKTETSWLLVDVDAVMRSHENLAAIGICRPEPKALARNRLMGAAWRRLYSLRATMALTRSTSAWPAGCALRLATNEEALSNSHGASLRPRSGA